MTLYTKDMRNGETEKEMKAFRFGSAERKD